MKLRMKLRTKYALIIALLIFATTLVFFSILISQVSKIIENITLKNFLNETKVFSEIKQYDFLLNFKPEFGYYYVLSTEGITLYHTDPTKIGIDVKTQVPGLLEYMKQEKSGVYSYLYQGVKRYVAFSYDGEKYFAHAAREDELFKDLKSLHSKIFKFLIPLMVIFSIIIGYIFGGILINPTKKQYHATNELLEKISDNVISTSTSTAEIKSMAQNTEEASMELDKAVEEFAAYFEESRAEVETTLDRIKDFTKTIEEITNAVTELTNMIESVGGFVEKITEISDNITVLAINASIETSKETIDRDGLSRIAEMIMELSNSTRSLTKESKNSLKDVEKVVTSTVLITEKISKELNNVRDSLNLIGQVVFASTQNTDKLSRISRNTHEAVEQLYAGVEQLEEAISQIKSEVEKFGQMFKNIEL